MTATLTEPRTCSWCGTLNPDPSSTNCINCAGPLPAPPGADPGPEPPPVPRTLPKGYENRIKYWKNVLVLIGIIFTIPFCWSVIFPIIGGFMWYFGAKKANAKLAALQRGTKARAQILDVYRDTSTTINGRSPWAVEYEFQGPGGTPIQGKAQGWEPENRRREPGQPLWVVYLPEDPEQNAIWPPIR